MRYAAIAEGRASWVDVREVEPGLYAVTIDGQERRWRGRPGDGAAWTLRDEESAEVHAMAVSGGDGGPRTVLGSGWAAEVEVMTARQLGQRGPKVAGAAGPDAVRVPMPGRVVTVLAGDGDRVTRGQPLAVVEAMKMENELCAPGDGVICGLTARPGDTLEGGSTLCTLA